GRTGAVESAAKTEDYIDLSFDFHGFAIEEIGLIAPTPHRLRGSRLKHGGTTDDPQVFDRSTLGNRCLQNNSSLNSCCFSDGGVGGVLAADAVALHHARGDGDLLGWSGLYLRGRTGAEASENAAHDATGRAHTFHAGYAGRRRSSLFPDQLDFFGNPGRSGELVVQHLGDHSLDVYRRRRWRWRGRRRRRSYQQGGHHGLGQRLRVNQRIEDE